MTWSVDAKLRAISNTWPLIPQEMLVPNSSWLFLTVHAGCGFCFVLFSSGEKNIFFTFEKYQRAGKVSMAHHPGDNKNKKNMDGYNSIYRNIIFIYQPTRVST